MSEEYPTSVRVFTPWQVCVSCLIGGPAAATWLIAGNFRAFDDRKKQKMTFFYGTITLLALLGMGLVLPNNSSVGALAAAVAVVAREITKRQQGSQLEAFRAKGGRMGSWWRAVGIGSLSLIATLVIIGIGVVSWKESPRKAPIDAYEISARQVPAAFARLNALAKDETFTVFVFSPGSGPFNPDEAINLQFSFEDGHIGFDWVLLGKAN